MCNWNTLCFARNLCLISCRHEEDLRGIKLKSLNSLKKKKSFLGSIFSSFSQQITHFRGLLTCFWSLAPTWPRSLRSLCSLNAWMRNGCVESQAQCCSVVWKKLELMTVQGARLCREIQVSLESHSKEKETWIPWAEQDSPRGQRQWWGGWGLGSVETQPKVQWESVRIHRLKATLYGYGWSMLSGIYENE